MNMFPRLPLGYDILRLSFPFLPGRTRIGRYTGAITMLLWIMLPGITQGQDAGRLVEDPFGKLPDAVFQRLGSGYQLISRSEDGRHAAFVTIETVKETARETVKKLFGRKKKD